MNTEQELTSTTEQVHQLTNDITLSVRFTKENPISSQEIHLLMAFIVDIVTEMQCLEVVPVARNDGDV